MLAEKTRTSYTIRFDKEDEIKDLMRQVGVGNPAVLISRALTILKSLQDKANGKFDELHIKRTSDGVTEVFNLPAVISCSTFHLSMISDPVPVPIS